MNTIQTLTEQAFFQWLVCSGVFSNGPEDRAVYEGIRNLPSQDTRELSYADLYHGIYLHWIGKPQRTCWVAPGCDAMAFHLFTASRKRERWTFDLEALEDTGIDLLPIGFEFLRQCKLYLEMRNIVQRLAEKSM